MEKEKKKQNNVNDHVKKAKSAKALHVSKYNHSCKNEREFMEDRSRKDIPSSRMFLQEMEIVSFQ